MAAGFDGFRFSDTLPIPSAYVVAYGMAHFRGPDGYLWFVKDNGNIAWDYPQTSLSSTSATATRTSRTTVRSTRPRWRRSAVWSTR